VAERVRWGKMGDWQDASRLKAGANEVSTPENIHVAGWRAEREARDPYLGPWLYTPSGCPKGAYAADIVARGTRRGETVRGARVVGERVDQRLRLCFFIFMALVARGSPGRV
jgi:hypothetical protein